MNDYVLSDKALIAYDACDYLVTADADGYTVSTTESTLHFASNQELNEFFEYQYNEMEGQ